MSRPKNAPDEADKSVPSTEDDTEGHSMLLDPSTAQHLAKARQADLERQLRDHKRQKEARGR